MYKYIYVKYPLFLSRPQGHSHTILNRNRDRPVCRAVPKPTAPPGAPNHQYTDVNISCIILDGIYLVLVYEICT